MRENGIRPTRFELAILRVLWDRGPLSVRDIQGTLNQSKETGYTTVLKMVQLMTGKGLLARDETVRPQLYRARLPQEQTQRGLLRDFIERAYGGSVRSLVLHALSTRKTSRQDLKAIEELLNSVEEQEK
ncbi:MAG TPA: BlaI/MecI/CopY family transcriptional regulator [Candidatus Koribacter sp.]